MFEKKSQNKISSDDNLGVFKPSKGSSKVIIGDGVKFKGEINDADEIQIDGKSDIIVNTENLIVGTTGELKGTINTDNADIWGKVDGDLTVTGTLTIQEQGSVSGTIEYQNLQIKLGGKILGDIKNSEKIKNINEKQKKDNISLQTTPKEENNSL